MTTLIRYSRGNADAPEGLAAAEAQHHRPDLLTAEQRGRFDRELDLGEGPKIEGHQVQLMVDPQTLGVAWYARKHPDEEGGQPGHWFLVQDIDMGQR